MMGTAMQIWASSFEVWAASLFFLLKVKDVFPYLNQRLLCHTDKGNPGPARPGQLQPSFTPSTELRCSLF